MAILFYIFSIFAVFNAVMLILLKNPIHSVLFLMLTFFNIAALFLLLNAEFLAMILLIVYVGAVATLFLFTIMMLDIDFAKIREGFAKFWIVGAVSSFILLAEIIAVIFVAFGAGGKFPTSTASPTEITNTEALGLVLYTDYAALFQISGLLLLVAMIGAIVLGLHHKKHVKRQNIYAQTTAKNTISLEKPEYNKGVEL